MSLPIDTWRRFAEQTLAKPPARNYIKRVDGRGKLVKQFFLPLNLLPTTNATRGASGWKLGKIKRELYDLMWLQNGKRAEAAALPGRPMVRCVRFTSGSSDAYGDWAKMAVDILCRLVPAHFAIRKKRGVARRVLVPARKRLGIIHDDNQRDAEVVQWTELAPPRNGFCLIEVWSGEE